MNATDLRFALAYNFGAEWDALTPVEQLCIVLDCSEDGGVNDIQQYRRNIGRGNLVSYAQTQLVRFNQHQALRNRDNDAELPLAARKMWS